MTDSIAKGTCQKYYCILLENSKVIVFIHSHESFHSDENDDDDILTFGII
jgi:hypothetical protein